MCVFSCWLLWLLILYLRAVWRNVLGALQMPLKKCGSVFLFRLIGCKRWHRLGKPQLL